MPANPIAKPTSRKAKTCARMPSIIPLRADERREQRPVRLMRDYERDVNCGSGRRKRPRALGQFLLRSQCAVYTLDPYLSHRHKGRQDKQTAVTLQGTLSCS